MIKYLLLLLLFSCAQSKVTYDISSVSLENENAESVEIDKNSQTDYGPTKTALETPDQGKRKAIVSLTFYSSIYHSLAFVDLIKNLEKRNINLSMISSQGFGSLIAAIYAKEKSSSYLEWKLFELLKSLKGKRVFSSDWRSVVNKFTKKEFGQLKVNQLKVMLLIPEIEDGGVILNKNGLVVDLIKSSLELSSTKNFFNSPVNYSDQLKSLGPDLNFHLAFIPKRVQFKSFNGLEWGIYTRYLGYLLKKSSNIHLMRSESIGEIDSLIPLTDISKEYSLQIKDYVESLEVSILKWQEESTTSL